MARALTTIIAAIASKGSMRDRLGPIVYDMADAIKALLELRDPTGWKIVHKGRILYMYKGSPVIGRNDLLIESTKFALDLETASIRCDDDRFESMLSKLRIALAEPV